MTQPTQTDAGRSAAASRSWRGAAIWSRGFRPFFLAAGVWALVSVALWPAYYVGDIAIPTAFTPVDWHAHELIFGYVGAVAAGFLLTAIPNWTGRLPVAGPPLAALAAVWGAGRVAVFFSAPIGRAGAAAIDCAFLLLFGALAAREVIAGRNGRNVKVVAIVFALAFVDLAFHWEDARYGFAPVSQRAGLALVVLLILLIGGRVTPSFTANWLARANVVARPAPFGRPDQTIMILSGVALALWVAAPESPWVGALDLIAGAANLWRLSRWRGWSARRDPLVLVLHLGFLFAGLGFVAVGAAALWPSRIPQAGGVHVWAIGAAGVMTLAMMTRATLGHSGRALVASRLTVLAFILVPVAALGRVAMALWPSLQSPLMHVAAAAWCAAFVAFLLAYAPMLALRSAPGRG